jgi:serine phosphatase RsbU (regulator of sigma subunit)
MVDRSVVVAVAARPHPREIVNGDSWSVDWHDELCRVCVIDGLGHGPEAAEAAERARSFLRAHPGLDPAQSLEHCHRELKPTRGAAIAVVSIDPIRAQLTFAGIGNVEARLWQADRVQRFASVRGIVGRPPRRARPLHAELKSGWLFLLHSDGIKMTYVRDADFPRQTDDPQRLADEILSRGARPTDDATVLIACDPGRNSTPTSVAVKRTSAGS